MKSFFYIILVFTSVFLQAKDISDVEKAAEEAHIANINTLLIFTSQEGLSSGLYHFTNVGVDMELYNLPFSYNFKSDTQLNYFIVGNVGYSRVYINEELERTSGETLTYDNHLRTYTGGIGAGLRYMFTEELTTSVGVEFIYSKSGASVKNADDNIGDAVEDFFDKNYNDNISYKFFTNIEYKTDLEKYKVYAIFNYKLYETKSTFDFADISSFNSQSSVATFSLGGESPKVYEYNEYYITLEAYLNANYLSGTVREVVGFDKYSSIGGIVYYNTPSSPSWASRFFLEISSVQSSGLEGYNIGLGFSADF